MAEAQTRGWSFEFDHPPDVVWSMMADTARFNEASGLPLHKIVDHPQPDGTVVTTGEGKVGWVGLKWREIPVNWVTGQWLEHDRVFERGPLKFLGAALQLESTAKGTRTTYRVTAVPATWFGRLMLKTKFFAAAERSYNIMAASANAYAKGDSPQIFPFKPPAVSADILARE